MEYAASWFFNCVHQRIIYITTFGLTAVNTLGPRQNGRHFPDGIFKWIFLNENAWIVIKISLKFVPNGPINTIPVLVQIMAWRRSGDKPLSEPMMVSLQTLTRPQWVKMSPPNNYIIQRWYNVFYKADISFCYLIKSYLKQCSKHPENITLSCLI